MSDYLHEFRDGLWLDFREGVRWEPGTLIIVDKPASDDKSAVSSYSVKAACSNCAWTGEIRRPKGALCESAYPCPDCGCSTVRSAHSEVSAMTSQHANAAEPKAPYS
jgi:hypothetical protein